MLKHLGLLFIALLLGGCPVFDSDSDDSELDTGLQLMQSGGETRAYYLLLPEDNSEEGGISTTGPAGPIFRTVGDPDKPLLIALHGTGGSYERWTERQIGYDLIDPVGDGAIMVFPNALPDATGSPQWSFAKDFDFFLDLIAELDKRGLQYDPDRIFVTGHSSGAGMAHEIGCRFGDIVRAIAPSAGTLTSTECVGAVAVLMSQGVNDRLVNFRIAEGARRFWSLYNGWDETITTDAEISPCVDHSLLGAANTPYPVYWCEHTEGSLDDNSGHRWASFTGEAVWAFFSSLPDKLPDVDLAAAPPGGGNERAELPRDTEITFTLQFPEELARPLDGALTLYDEDYLDNPTFSIPSVFLNPLWVVGDVGAGDTVTYTVPVTFLPAIDTPSSWTLSINVYVEGGTRPTPTAGLDLQAQQVVTFTGPNTPLIVDEVLPLVPARCFFNCEEP